MLVAPTCACPHCGHGREVHSPLHDDLCMVSEQRPIEDTYFTETQYCTCPGWPREEEAG